MLLAIAGLSCMILCYAAAALIGRGRPCSAATASQLALPIAALAISSAIATAKRSIAAPTEFITRAPEDFAVWAGLGVPLIGLGIAASTVPMPRTAAHSLPLTALAGLGVAALLVVAGRLHFVEGQLLILAAACALWADSLAADSTEPPPVSAGGSATFTPLLMMAGAAGAALCSPIAPLALAAGLCALAGSVLHLCLLAPPERRLRAASLWGVTAAGVGLGGSAVAVTIVTAAADAPMGGARAVVDEIAARAATRPYIAGLRAVAPELVLALLGVAMGCRRSTDGRRDPGPAAVLATVAAVLVLIRVGRLGG